SIQVKDDPLLQFMLDYQKPLSIEDAENEPLLAGFRYLLRQSGTVSLLVAPFLIQGEVIGGLSLGSNTPRRFLPEEINLVWSVATQVAGVLARLRLDEERRRLEAQYYQAQRMEALGRLTGGVAHDFNNLLTVIIGNNGFVLDELGPDHALRHSVEQIQKAAEGAAGLVRHLLAFSRQQVLQPKILNLNEIVGHMEKMLRRVIGEDIDLATALEPQLGQVKADPSQLGQIIMNLVVNARDAMPEGGKLTIETSSVYLDEVYTRQHPGLEPGPYVLLAITDTGIGMDAQTRAHIFEPFFTTKEVGKGTGLGLATVHGIVHQSGGHIWVYSEPGRGTTFKIYLPQLETSSEPVELPPLPARPRQGSETILLVEDDKMVRELSCFVLRNHGYTVLTAGDGEQARCVCAEHAGPIQLLLTDVVIPGGMTGPQLAGALAPLWPQMKVLYMSGYADNAIVQNRILDSGAAYLPKPFTPDDLARKVRAVLDEEAGRNAAQSSYTSNGRGGT
ncbi:MAG: ATP-binding protein, partial [Chloroflexota bacterium]